MVLVKGGTAFYCSERESWFSLVDGGFENPREIAWLVTHWQPLPTLPEEQPAE